MTGQIIYEVNLTVDKQLEVEYSAWLQQHVEQMLSLPGFITATSYRVTEPVPPSKACWTVHYVLQHQAALDQYLQNHAPAMREDGVKHFGNRFTASRRIYQAN